MDQCPHCGYTSDMPIPPAGFHLLSETQRNICRVLMRARGAMVSAEELALRVGLSGTNSLGVALAIARKRLPALRHHIYSRPWSGYGWIA